MAPLSSVALYCALASVAFAASPPDFKAGVFENDFEGLYFGEEAEKHSLRAPMQLQLLQNTASTGAVCLDGTPAGFYFASAADAANKNNWQIYFQGGGWCYDEEDCWGRSSTGLGSSTHWAKTSTGGGIMSDDCTVNPDFCNFNRVHMAYCDGNSFSGNRDEPVVVTGLDGKKKPLYFRGRRIIDQTLAALVKLGLGNAENVLLTGCSAGGLATYLHTDYVHERLTTLAPKMTKFRASAISGFFLDHKTVEGKPVYPTEMQTIFALANSTHGLNDACIAAMPASEQWRCNFAQYAYQYTTSPTFPLNSALDSWQTGCIYTSELVPGFPNQNVTNNGDCAAAPGWSACARNPEACNASQIMTMNQYIVDFRSAMEVQGQATYSKNGNGAFVHSCHTHCEAQSPAWNKFAIGGVTIQQAVSKWWNSDGKDTAEEHTYTPCLYKSTSKHECNPTCG
eukprot:m.485760 g.485760  ORF g.485760 m.485760 type:complete len:453 (+) comp23953_c0_seq1:161-1519(+)